MANRVYLNVYGTSYTMEAPCTEDIVIDAKSSFSSFGELVPGAAGLVSMVNTITAGMNSNVGVGMLNLTNALDVPRWQKTEPVRVSLDMNFYIKTDPYEDVWRPTMLIMAMQVLSENRSEGGDSVTSYITPGVSLATMGKVQSKGGFSDGAPKLDIDGMETPPAPKPDEYPNNAKLCSLYIPGIVYIPLAYVESANPTWSKQLTIGGFPLWSKVNLQVTGLFPAVFETNFLSVNPNGYFKGSNTAFEGAINTITELSVTG
jgi:hypothetical protein